MENTSSEDEAEEKKSLIFAVKDAALWPVHLAISPAALRAYLRSVLSIIAALSLLTVSIVAYILFYNLYIPAKSFTVPIHLQFGPGQAGVLGTGFQHPAAIEELKTPLVARQGYDVEVVLELPRSRRNTEMGNFMVEVLLLGRPSPVSMKPGDTRWDELMIHKWGHVRGITSRPEALGNILATSQRPAILTYYHPWVDHTRRLLMMAGYVLGLWKEQETIELKMMEGVEFEKGAGRIPARVGVRVQCEGRAMIYSARAVFEAKFKGLRYFMHNYRITSFLIFTTAFWLTSSSFALSIWYIAPTLLSDLPNSLPAQDEQVGVKRESDTEPGLSDTTRTSPSVSSHPRLHYSPPRAREEPAEEPISMGAASDEPAESDIDEDGDSDLVSEEPGMSSPRGLVTDSGVGTGLESTAQEGAIRRRRSSGK